MTIVIKWFPPSWIQIKTKDLILLHRPRLPENLLHQIFIQEQACLNID
jgi:hypothetical protein